MGLVSKGLERWDKEPQGGTADFGRNVSFSRACCSRRILVGQERMRLVTIMGRGKHWKMGREVCAKPERMKGLVCGWDR